MQDGVVFTIHFTANCCPHFNVYSALYGDTLHICLVDDRAGCRCLCPYDNRFLVQPLDPGPLRLVFAQELGCPTRLDTLVTIPERSGI